MIFTRERGADRELEELMISRSSQPEDTVIEIPLPRGKGSVRIGDGGLFVMAGPCTLETREQVMDTAAAVKSSGACLFRDSPLRRQPGNYA